MDSYEMLERYAKGLSNTLFSRDLRILHLHNLLAGWKRVAAEHKRRSDRWMREYSREMERADTKVVDVVKLNRKIDELKAENAKLRAENEALVTASAEHALTEMALESARDGALEWNKKCFAMSRVVEIAREFVTALDDDEGDPDSYVENCEELQGELEEALDALEKR